MCRNRNRLCWRHSGIFFLFSRTVPFLAFSDFITHSAANFKTNCLGRFSLLLVLEGRGSKMSPNIGSGGFSVPCLNNASNYMTAASFHIPFNSSCLSVLEFRTLRTVVNYHHMKVCWDVDIELHRVVISRQWCISVSGNTTHLNKPVALPRVSMFYLERNWKLAIFNVSTPLLRFEFILFGPLDPWRWRHQVLSKRRASSNPAHGVTSSGWRFLSFVSACSSVCGKLKTLQAVPRSLILGCVQTCRKWKLQNSVPSWCFVWVSDLLPYLLGYLLNVWRIWRVRVHRRHNKSL
jgi:hypothetical protein